MDTTTPQYGKIKTNITLGDGTKVERVRSYQKHQLIDERNKYEERTRVKTMDEAMETVVALARRVELDDTLLDPGWYYDGRSWLAKRGSFDVVFCYTKVMGGKQ